MCLFPLNIRTPTRRIAKCGGQALRYKVACGKCAQCIQNKRDEWLFRANEEVRNTFDKGGYVLFDTLTYRDDDLPHLSDFVDVKKYNI